MIRRKATRMPLNLAQTDIVSAVLSLLVIAISLCNLTFPAAVIWMKFNRKEEDAPVEVKAYRTSFVRAALLLTAARHEAQLQVGFQSLRVCWP